MTPKESAARTAEDRLAWPDAIAQRIGSEPVLPSGVGSETAVLVDALLPADSPRLSGMDDKHIDALSQVIDEFPPILVHRKTMRVIDGMHRLRATVARGRDMIRVQFFDGTEQAAFVLAVQLNATHGLPLTLADRRAATHRLLRQHPEWSDRAIARIVGMTHKTVSAVRRSSGENPQQNTRRGQDGRLRPANAAERRIRARELISQRPHASLREIAKAAGVSPSTVMAVRSSMADEVTAEPVAKVVSLPVGPRPESSEPDPHQVDRLRSLWKALVQDPEVRFTDTGRALLRMLQIQAVTDPDTWDQLVFAVPPRHAGTVADLAEQCARMWEGFADKMRRREQRN